MRWLVAFLFFFLNALAVGCAHAQDFSHVYSKSVQPVLSQPLQWVSAASTAAPNLPEAFLVNPGAWVFSPYTFDTTLPTATGNDAWLKFTLAATPMPQSWVVRIPRVTIRKVSLYESNANGFLPAQAAGTSIAHSAWIRNTRTPSFEVVSGNTDKTFYLRIEHYTAVIERPELLSQADFADGATRVGTLLGLMFGMFGMLTLACLVVCGVARKTVFVSLAAFVLAMLLHFLVQLGYGGWRLWPNSASIDFAMNWTAPLIAMATGCWFFAQASYAKDISKPIYGLLCWLAVGSLGLGLYRLINAEQLPRSFLNAWALMVLVTVVASLLWLSLRGLRTNLWLLAGLLPLVAVGGTSLARNLGWSGHTEVVLANSVLLAQIGLMSLFVALLWRSRTALLSSDLAIALNQTDETTGLIRERVARIRLPSMLSRANHLKLGCGVIMLRWHNYPQLKTALSVNEQSVVLRFLGQLLSRAVREVDTAAHFGDGHFILLIEGPVGRQGLSSLATHIVTSCLRESDNFKQADALTLHMAIWHAAAVPTAADEVLEALKTRLNQMSYGTKRPVQFVDVASSDMATESNSEQIRRRDDVMAKINAIEASPSVHAILMPDKPRKA